MFSKPYVKKKTYSRCFIESKTTRLPLVVLNPKKLRLLFVFYTLLESVHKLYVMLPNSYREDFCLQTLCCYLNVQNVKQKLFVSTANSCLVCILITIGGVTDIFATGVAALFPINIPYIRFITVQLPVKNIKREGNIRK